MILKTKEASKYIGVSINTLKTLANMVFTSRYDSVKPDYDFIDLGALARNMKHSIWLENMYEAGDK